MCLLQNPYPRRKHNIAHSNQIPARCIESFGEQQRIYSDDRPKRAFADSVLFSVAVKAKWDGPFVVWFLAHAAVFVVGPGLHSHVGGLARFVVAAETWKLSDHCQIDRIGITDDFQLDPLRYAEGAFEQVAGVRRGGDALRASVLHGRLFG